MKLFKYLPAIAAGLFLAFGLVACGGDDDALPEPEPEPTQYEVRIYVPTLKVQDTFMDGAVTITNDGKDLGTVKLSDMKEVAESDVNEKIVSDASLGKDLIPEGMKEVVWRCYTLPEKYTTAKFEATLSFTAKKDVQTDLEEIAVLSCIRIARFNNGVYDYYTTSSLEKRVYTGIASDYENLSEFCAQIDNTSKISF